MSVLSTSHRSRRPPEPQTASGDTLRQVLRQHAAGVTIVTVPGPAGFTATSFTSVSLEPALLSFCIGWSASTLPHVRAAEHFAVHLLSADGAELARRFARSGVDRFAGVDWSPTPEGVPRLQGTNGWLLARVVLRQRLGDHLQVVGEVQAVDSDTASPPLVHHNGAFTTARNL